jgi:hypothetical protein
VLREILLEAAREQRLYLADARSYLMGGSRQTFHIEGKGTYTLTAPAYLNSEITDPLFHLHNNGTLTRCERDGTPTYSGILWTGGIYAMRAGRSHPTPAEVLFHRIQNHTHVGFSLLPEWQALAHRYHDGAEKPELALPPARVLALSVVSHHSAVPAQSDSASVVAAAYPRFEGLLRQWLYQLAERHQIEVTVK